MIKIGQGIDFHCFDNEKTEIILGGLKIDSNFGIKAHSDGDIIIHSIMDSILGALGLGDIGQLFPDNDPKYKNINSSILLEHVLKKMNELNYAINNVDTTIICEQPKITPLREKIIKNLSKLLNLENTNISVKGTTTEKMGFIGKNEGIGCSTVILLTKKDSLFSIKEKTEKNLKSQVPLNVYTDGSCLGNPGPGGWGVVIKHPKKEVILSGGEENTTNNRMELTATIKALDFLLNKKIKNIVIHTDSNYVMMGITEWIKNWKKNSWKTAKKDPVLNQDLWKELDELRRNLDVEFKWIKAHVGHPENEKCDAIAKSEAEKYNNENNDTLF